MIKQKYMVAYGMNTNLSSMATRCPAAKSMGAVTLKGYKLAFKYFCDVVVDPAAKMECVLWNITDDCEQSLDATEGYPDFYGKKEVDVTHDGRKIRAMIYYMTGRDQPAQPSESYLNMVTQGYSEHNINIMQLVTALEELTTCG